MEEEIPFMKDENPYLDMIQDMFQEIDRKSSSLNSLIEFMNSLQQQISQFLFKKTEATQKLQDESNQDTGLKLFSDHFTAFQQYDENFINKFLTVFHDNSIKPLLELSKSVELFKTSANEKIDKVSQVLLHHESNYLEEYELYIDYCKDNETKANFEFNREFEKKCLILCKELGTIRKKYCLEVEQIFCKFETFNESFNKTISKCHNEMITLIEKLKDNYQTLKDKKIDDQKALESRLQLNPLNSPPKEATNSLDSTLNLYDMDIYAYSNPQFLYKNVLDTPIVIATCDCINNDSNSIICKKGDILFYYKKGKPFNAENVLTRLKGNIKLDSFKQSSYKKHIVRLKSDFTDDMNRFYDAGFCFCALYEKDDKTICMNDSNTVLLIKTDLLETVK